MKRIALFLVFIWAYIFPVSALQLTKSFKIDGMSMLFSPEYETAKINEGSSITSFQLRRKNMPAMHFAYIDFAFGKFQYANHVQNEEEICLKTLEHVQQSIQKIAQNVTNFSMDVTNHVDFTVGITGLTATYAGTPTTVFVITAASSQAIWYAVIQTTDEIYLADFEEILGTVETSVIPYLEVRDTYAHYREMMRDQQELLARNNGQSEPLHPSPQSRSNVDINIPHTTDVNSHTFAVIIANEDYQEEAPVPYAVSDGKIFQQYCLQTLGLPEQNIHFRANATQNNMKAEIRWLNEVCQAFGSEANVVFYYAGHGIPDESTRSSYLLPIDGSGSDIMTGYQLNELYTTLGNLSASRVLVFIDACFSGSKREAGMLASARGVALKAKSGVPQGNMVVFSAAQGDETAYPNNDEGHGMFTYYLLKKLQETSGDVTLYDLGNYITKNVSQQSILINGKSQTPNVTASSALGTNWQSWKLK